MASEVVLMYGRVMYEVAQRSVDERATQGMPKVRRPASRGVGSVARLRRLVGGVLIGAGTWVGGFRVTGETGLLRQ